MKTLINVSELLYFRCRYFYSTVCALYFLLNRKPILFGNVVFLHHLLFVFGFFQNWFRHLYNGLLFFFLSFSLSFNISFSLLFYWTWLLLLRWLFKLLRKLVKVVLYFDLLLRFILELKLSILIKIPGLLISIPFLMPIHHFIRIMPLLQFFRNEVFGHINLRHHKLQ